MMKKTVMSLVEHEAGDALRRTAPVVEDMAGEVLKRTALLLAGSLLMVTVAVATTLNPLAVRFDGRSGAGGYGRGGYR
jgi:hypothetical protein